MPTTKCERSIGREVERQGALCALPFSLLGLCAQRRKIEENAKLPLLTPSCAEAFVVLVGGAVVMDLRADRAVIAAA